MARSPVTIRSARAAIAHPRIRMSGSSSRTECRSGGIHYFRQLDEEHRGPCELLAVAAELSCQHPRQLVANGFRDRQCVGSLDDTPERPVATAIGERKRGGEDVRVEHNLHDRRCRSRSSSVKMPSRCARSLQNRLSSPNSPCRRRARASRRASWMMALSVLP